MLLLSEKEILNILNEAMYFPNRPKELDKIDEAFQNIIDILDKNPLKNINNTPYPKIIEENIKSLFNFENCDLKISTSAISNAYTFPLTWVHMSYKHPYDMVKTNSGIKYKESKGKTCFICFYTSLITTTKLSARECTSVLLHELGHNFYYNQLGLYFYTIITIFEMIYQIIQIVLQVYMGRLPIENIQVVFEDLCSMIMSISFTRKAVYKLTAFDREKLHGIFRGIGNIQSTVFTTLSDIFNNIFMILGAPIIIFTTPFMAISSLPSSFLRLFVQDMYRNEKFADNFATAYGYGAEVASCMNKYEDYSNVSSSGKFLLPPYLNLISSYAMLLVGMTDEHPLNITRIKEQKALLVRALSENDLSSEQKKIVLKDIERIDSICNNFYNSTKDNPAGRKLSKIIIEDFLGGSTNDWRELLFKTKDYDWSYQFENRT